MTDNLTPPTVQDMTQQARIDPRLWRLMEEARECAHVLTSQHETINRGLNRLSPPALRQMPAEERDRLLRERELLRRTAGDPWLQLKRDLNQCGHVRAVAPDGLGGLLQVPAQEIINRSHVVVGLTVLVGKMMVIAGGQGLLHYRVSPESGQREPEYLGTYMYPALMRAQRILNERAAFSEQYSFEQRTRRQDWTPRSSGRALPAPP